MISFLNSKDICKKEGINVPIIPGLKPISTKKQLEYSSAQISL